MSFLNRKSIAGKMLMGLCCVAVLTLFVAAMAPFEPAAAMAANEKGAESSTPIANAGR